MLTQLCFDLGTGTKRFSARIEAGHASNDASSHLSGLNLDDFRGRRGFELRLGSVQARFKPLNTGD
jgi:hypothetical protein